MITSADKGQTPEPLWTVRLNQPVKQRPVVVDGRLFLPTQSANRGAQHSALIVLDSQSGALLWEHHFEYALISGLQAYWLPVRQEKVVVLSTHSSDLLRGAGDVGAFTAGGEQIWQWQNKEKSYSAPVVKNLQVVVLAGDSTLAVVSPEAEGDDDVVRIPLPVATSLAAPVLLDQVAYIPCRAAELVAMDLNGALQWHFRIPDKPHAWLDYSPVLNGETVFCVSREGGLYALQAATGQLNWQAHVGNNRPMSSPVATDNTVFVGTRNGLVALNSQNGQTRWTFDTKRPISAAPLIIHDTVYVGCEDHNLYALDLESGAECWRFGLPGRIEVAPVQMDNALLICDRGGTLVALPLPEQPQVDKAGFDAGRAEVAQIESPLQEYQTAAQKWLASGDLEKAAQALEDEGAWLKAAQVWQQLDRYGKRADALEQYAKQLEKLSDDDEEIGAAWAQAARAHAELGQKEARLRCEREAARHRRQPILSIEIKPERLFLNAWSKLDFTIHNEGFGTAVHVLVQVVDDHFEGQALHTQTMPTILPKRSYTHWLDILPKAMGIEVPMRLAIEYGDRLGNSHRLERRFYLTVAGKDKASSSHFVLSDTRSFARLEAPDGRDLALLRNQMINAFSKDEIYNLLFDFGLRADDFGDRISTITRELITYAVQTDQLEELIDMCKKHHPYVDW